jgi:hypothetical protein
MILQIISYLVIFVILKMTDVYFLSKPLLLFLRGSGRDRMVVGFETVLFMLFVFIYVYKTIS